MTLGQFTYIIIGACTGIIGHQIHGSVFWAILNGLLPPVAWIKWIICQEVTWSIIKNSFDWFFN
jgi:hypothetical protein